MRTLTSPMSVPLLVLMLSAAAPPEDAPPAPGWKARLTVGLRAADLDSPRPAGLSLFWDALLELRMFDHVALQAGSWPVVTPAPPPALGGSCASPSPATFRLGVSEYGEAWEVGALAGVTWSTNNVQQCLSRQYLVLMPFIRLGRDQDFGADLGAGFLYTTLKEVWLGGHAPLGRMRAFLDARFSAFGWAEANLGVEVPGALVRLPKALALRLEAGLAAVGWTVTPPWRLGPQGGVGLSWTW